MSRRSSFFATLLLAACNSQPAPTPAQEPAAPTDANAATSPAGGAGRQFGAAFTLSASESLASAVARLGKAEAAPAGGSSPGGEHACGGDHGHAKADAATPGEAKASKAAPSSSGEGKSVESCGEITHDATGKTVRVSGTVSAVCQKAGCWMALQDGNVEARIFTREHRFFMPKDIAGKRAEVEGSLRVNDVSEKFAKHLAEDGGKDPASVNGPAKEYVVNATGVRILD